MKKGFTYIELLVVIAMIGVLATLTFVMYARSKESSRYSKAKTDIELIAQGILMLAKDTGKWPGSQLGSLPVTCRAGNAGSVVELNQAGYNANRTHGDEICLSDTTDEIGLMRNFNPANSSWAGPYMEKNISLDPWGMGYILDTDFWNMPYDNNLDDPTSPTYTQRCGGDAPTLAANAVAIVSAGPDRVQGYPCTQGGKDDAWKIICRHVEGDPVINSCEPIYD